jgi:hypothetical protein
MRRVGFLFGTILVLMMLGGLFMMGRAALYWYVASNDERQPVKVGAPRDGTTLAPNELLLNYTDATGRKSEKFIVDPEFAKTVKPGDSLVIHTGPVFGRVIETTRLPLWNWIVGGLLFLIPIFVLTPTKRTPPASTFVEEPAASEPEPAAAVVEPEPPSETAETPPS